MKKDLANLSTDLRRISYWLYQGRIDLAQSFLKRCPQIYQKINPQISCYHNIWAELKKIADLKEGSIKASERALTASLILLHRSGGRNENFF